MYQTKLEMIFEAMSAARPVHRTPGKHRRPATASDAWARHASSSNGFGDAFTSESHHNQLTDI